MTLEDAIRQILLENRQEMTAISVAKAINDQQLFRRRDNKPVPAGQIELRARDIPASFRFVWKEGIEKIDLIHRAYSGKSTDYHGIFWDLSNLMRDQNLIVPSEILVVGMVAYLILAEQTETLELKNLDELLEVPEIKQQLLKDLNGFMESGEGEYFLPWFRLQECITEADEALIKKVLKILNQYEMEICQEFFDAVDGFIYSNFAIQSNSRIITPSTISRVVDELADIKENAVVYDPAAGPGILAINALVNSDLTSKEEVRLQLQEYSSIWSNLSYFISRIKGVPNAEIRNENSLINPICEPESVDWVISDLLLEDIDTEVFKELDILGFGESEVATTHFLQLILTRLKDSGRAIVLVSNDFLFDEDPSSKILREYLVESDFLEAVITFPSGKFPPMLLSTTLLIINKTKETSRKNRVLFINANEIWNQPTQIKLIYEEYEEKNNLSRSVDLQEIAECEYDLLINRYISDIESELKAVSEDGTLYPLRYLSLKHRFSPFKKGADYPFIKVEDLPDSDTGYLLDISMIKDSSKTKTYGRIIDRDAILLAKNGGKMSPTLFRFDGDPVTVSNDIHPIVVDHEIVVLEYLLSELNMNYSRKQYNAALKGDSTHSISVYDLMNIKVRVHGNLDTQIKILKERAEFVSSILNVQRSYQDQEKAYQQKEFQILSAIKHSFAQLQGAVSSDIKNLKYFIDFKNKNKEIIDWEDRISARPGTRNIKEVFQDMDASLEKMARTFENIQNILDFHPSKMKKSIVSIPEFIKQETREFLGNRTDYQLIFDMNESSPLTAEMDRQQFSEVVRNFLHNTEEHGFEGLNIQKKLEFKIRTNRDQTKLIIDLKNNGKPMPPDFSFEDFVTFGTRNGEKGGSGIGGYLMNKVIENHGGKMMLLNRTPSVKGQGRYDIGVQFRIELPLKQELPND